jgi:hypothetical protein
MPSLHQVQNRSALAATRASLAAEQATATALATRYARLLATAYETDGEPRTPPATHAAQWITDGARATAAAVVAGQKVAIVDAAIALFDGEIT